MRKGIFMRRGWQLVSAWLASLLLTAASAATSSKSPVASVGNDNAKMMALGRQLFFDPRLSETGSTPCSNCHQPDRAFSDGRPTSVGTDQRIGTRNTPSLLNVFDDEPLFWDGRRTGLDVATLDPLVNRAEMGNPDIPSVLRRLQGDPKYRTAFAKAFPQNGRAITAENLGKALAAFVTSLPRLPNAFDQWKAGQSDALSPQAQEGFRLFTAKAECAQCHDPAQGRFTDEKFHHSGVGLGKAETHLASLTETAMQQNLPIAALGSAIGSDAELATLGRFLVSHQAVDVGAFRTPSLRNVALTAPYMHDGSVKTLEDAVQMEIYYRGLSTGRPIALTMEEQQDLLAFLRSLSSTPGSKPSAL